MKTMRYLLGIGLLVLSACSPSGSPEKDLHPIIGKWHLALVDDSSVVDNPHIIGMEFKEDGTIIQFDGGESYSAKYIVSDDTTSISVLEGGKPVSEFKVSGLSREELKINEGFHVITFRKVH